MIDAGVRHPWPQDVREALARFKQGDLIERPPFFYYAALRRPLWGTEEADEVEEGEEFDVVDLGGPDAGPPYGIITTQTCDLNEERRDPLHPWFQIAPVYKLVGTLDEVEATLQRQYLFKLHAPVLTEGTWVADLRIEVPLEKSVLVGKEPIEAFDSEAGYIAFAARIGRRRDRAALASELVDAVAKSLSRRRRNNRNRFDRIFQSVQSVRLDINEGSRLRPVAAQVYIVTRGPISDEDMEWFESWWDTARQEAEGHDIRLLPNGYHNGTGMDVELYESLIDLGIGA